MRAGTSPKIMKHLNEVMKDFITLAKKSRDFFASDASVTVAAACLKKFGKIYCDSWSLILIPPNSYRVFTGAIKALEEAGYRPISVSAVAGEVGVAVRGWRSLSSLEKSIESAARDIARRLDFPVGVEATLVMTEDPSRPCYKVSAIAYGPGDVALLLRRVIRLMAELGLEPAVAWPGASAGHANLPKPLLSEASPKAFKVVMDSNCHTDGSTSLGDEAPEDYGIDDGQEISQCYPTSCESIRRAYLGWFIPKYRHGWDCLRSLERLGEAKILNVTSGEGFVEAVLRIGDYEALVRCGERGDDNFVEAEERDALMAGIRAVARAYFMSVSPEEAGIDPRIVKEYLKRVAGARDLCEVIETALEAEEV